MIFFWYHFSNKIYTLCDQWLSYIAVHLKKPKLLKSIPTNFNNNPILFNKMSPKTNKLNSQKKKKANKQTLNCPTMSYKFVW